MFFQKNIEGLKSKNPELVAKLSAINIDDIKNKFLITKSHSGDVIILHNRIVLDSTINPQQAVEEAWNTQIKHPELKSTDLVFLFGLGLGYLFKKASVSTQARIIMFEPEIEVIRFVLEYADFSAELKQERITIVNSISECTRYLMEKYIQNDIIEIIYNVCYQYSYMKEFELFTNELLRTFENKIADIQTAARYNTVWVRNTFQNIHQQNDYIPLNFIKNIFTGKTALITAAGPSLKKDTELIKRHRNKFVIFAVNKIYEYLVSEGITPDFTVFSDAEKCANCFKRGIPEKINTNIIMNIRTDNFCSHLNVNHRFLMFGKNDPFSQLLNEKMPEMTEISEASQTTTGMAYYAAKMLGFDKIIFSGLDLAFKEDIMYADSTQVNIQNGKVLVSGTNTKNIVYIESFKKEKIRSREDYALFAHELGDIFKNQNKIKIYNTTDFGANIEGMIYLPLQEILEETDIVELNQLYAALSDKKFLQSRELFIENMQHALNDVKKNVYEIKDILTNTPPADISVLQLITSNILLEPMIENKLVELVGKLENKIPVTDLETEFFDIYQKTLENIDIITS